MLLTGHWWLLALRGISSVIFGLYFFVYPELTLELLWKGFCLYAFADGAFCVLAALFAKRNRWLRLFFLLTGLTSFTAGLLALYQPLTASFALLLSVGFWAILTGILEIFTGVITKGELEKTGWLKIAGVISVLIGIYIIAQPLIGFPSLATLIGIFQIIRGIINVLISLSIKRNRKLLEDVLNES